MNVGFIGTGTMGSMLVRALVRSGALRPGQVWAANRTPAKLQQLAQDVPGIHTAPPAAVARAAHVLFLCVKPGETATALDQVRAELRPDQLLVTLSNMIPIAGVEARVPCRVAKVIPSLAQQAGGGVALVMYGQRVRAADRETLERLLAAIARPLVVEEHQGRTCSDLTSCGPAFLAYVLREMARAATEVQPDLPLSLAEAMVKETVLATARLLVEGGLQFDEIMARVAVPGGITAEGLRVLAERVPRAWRECLTTTRAVEEEKKARLQEFQPAGGKD